MLLTVCFHCRSCLLLLCICDCFLLFVVAGWFCVLFFLFRMLQEADVAAAEDAIARSDVRFDIQLKALSFYVYSLPHTNTVVNSIYLRN